MTTLTSITSSRRWRARLAPLLALLTLAALLAACGGEGEGTTPAAPGTPSTPGTTGTTGTTGATATPGTPGAPGDALTDVTLMLNWTPNAQHAGIYVALANGWYEEAGLNLRIVEPAAAGADQVTGTGGVEFGISQAESVLPARAAGIPVVSIATILPYNDSSFMTLGDSGITRPRDFEGKTYGGFGGALETELVHTLVACDGGDPDAVQMVEVGNIDYLAGMEQGRFDFVWVFEGWDALRAREVTGHDIGTVRFVEWLDCIPDWYTPVFITNEGMMEARPEIVRAFLEATARGYMAAIADPDGAASALLAAAPELDEELVRLSTVYHSSRFVGEAPWGVQDTEVWSRFSDFLVQAGLLDQPVDTDEAFTNEFILPGQ